MKKIIIGIIVVLTAGFWACRKEGRNAAPGVWLDHGPEYVAADTILPAGSLLRFRVEMHGDGYDITNFLIRVTTDTARTVFDTGLHAQNFEWEGSFFRGFHEKESWRFIVRDRWGNDASVSLDVFLDTQTNFKPLLHISDISLGAQDNPAPGSFYSFESLQSYFTSECNEDPSIQSLVDLVFYFGDDLSTIASPGANIESGIFEGDLGGWQVRNTTHLMKTQFSQEDFDGIKNDSILFATYEESLAKRKAKDLQLYDNYVFRLQNGKLGVFLIKEVGEGPEGRIIFDAKLQPE